MANDLAIREIIDSIYGNFEEAAQPASTRPLIAPSKEGPHREPTPIKNPGFNRARDARRMMR